MNKSWPSVKLGEIVKDLTNERIFSVKSDDEIIDPTISSATHTISVAGKNSGLTVRIKKRVLICPGDLVFSRLHTQNGAFAFSDQYFHATTTFIPLSINEKMIEPRFLFWALHSCVPTLSASDSVGRETYKTSQILNLEIPLPYLQEQQRILRRLEEFQLKIEKICVLRKQTIIELEEMQASAIRRVIQNVSAEKVDLQDVCTAIIDNLHSTPKYSENGIPCIRSPDVGWGKLNLIDAFRTDDDEYLRRVVRGAPKADDIVLVREGGGTGKAAIVLPDQKFSLGQRVMMIRPDKEKVIPRFFLYQILSPLIQEDQILPICKGSASPHLNIGSLKKFHFRLPSLSDQNRIVTYLDEFLAKKEELKIFQDETAIEIKALLPSILNKAFKGEL